MLEQPLCTPNTPGEKNLYSRCIDTSRINKKTDSGCLKDPSHIKAAMSFKSKATLKNGSYCSFHTGIFLFLTSVGSQLLALFLQRAGFYRPKDSQIHTTHEERSDWSANPLPAQSVPLRRYHGQGHLVRFREHDEVRIHSWTN